MLPDISGEQTCDIIIEKSDISIIMLTAKIEDNYWINGVNSDYDDYIYNHFNAKELIGISIIS